MLEAIVLGLSTPVLISVESVDTGRRRSWVGLGSRRACLLTAGMLRMRWAYPWAG